MSGFCFSHTHAVPQKKGYVSMNRPWNLVAVWEDQTKLVLITGEFTADALKLGTFWMTEALPKAHRVIMNYNSNVLLNGQSMSSR